MNPLRAGLVKDLKELDKYPWTGHSAILGRCKDSLKPNKLNKLNRPTKSLAEKTIEDVLLHFGETMKVAPRGYREFVKKGIAQGTRPELQGGGLVRSAGGDRRGLLGRKKGEREKGDPRILGSGDFVSRILREGDKVLEKKYLRKPSIRELIESVARQKGVSPELICSGSRKRQICEARSLLAYLAVEQSGHKATDVARVLGVKRVSVHNAVKKAERTFKGLS